jgi:hypothetical protein
MATRKARAVSLLPLLAIAFFVFLALYRLNPPAAVPADSPPDGFSSGRALKHLRAITRAPHPLGSAEHVVVREYILNELRATGVTPEVQETTAVRHSISRASRTFQAATVRNVVARLSGTDRGRAVLLASHYDSVIKAPGAGDDGVAVAAMLETLRALRAGPPLKNDIIFLFTDGEEPGLLGAKAFTDEHPWAKEVGLALNFDARGTSGPVVMFETSSENRWLIEEFARHAEHPVSSSLFYDLYRLLPNDTDMTVFRQAGMAGLNFAFLDGYINYHTPLDKFESIDERTLQHVGLSALASTRHFGNVSLQEVKDGDATYFDVLGLRLVNYPQAWNLPLVVFTSVLFLAVAALGIRRGRLSVAKILLGAAALLLAALIAYLLITLAWTLVRALHGGYKLLPAAHTYNSNLYLAGFTAVTVCITALIFGWFTKRVNFQNLALGASLWWLVLLFLCVAFLPGASYLTTWTLLFYLSGLALVITWKESDGDSPTGPAILSLFAIPGVVLLVPLIRLAFIGLGFRIVGVLMVLVALLLGLLSPALYLLARINKWLLPSGAAVVALVFILAGSLTSGFSQSRPRPDVIFYGLNADTGKAFWLSTDAMPDEWTSQFFTANVMQRIPNEFLPFALTPLLTAQATATQLAAPQVVLVSDETNGNTRDVSMRITSTRQAPSLFVSIDPGIEVLEASVNGKKIEREGRNGESPDGLELRYYGLPPEGFDLTVKIKPPRALELRVIDQSYKLPELPFSPRPEHIRQGLYFYSDTTLVTKNFTF